jgi:DNA-binding CsgD family transcriptional regulator
VALGKVLGALHALRGEPSPVQVIERAAPELCATGLFDRVMLSLVQGSTWLPKARYAYGSTGRVHRELTLPDDLAIPLASPLLEAEVVRRRLPALVENAEMEPRLYRALIERTGTTQFVVAPIVAESSVIALLHGELSGGGRSLTTIDRDLLRMYSDGVGVMYERAELAQRIELQRAAVAQVFDAAAGSLRQMETPPTLAFTGPVLRAAQELGRERPAVKSRGTDRLTRLTAREREVLALLSSGATNSQLADRLTVAESTVKSHVKHILHKLGARNRAEAIACYMRDATGDQRRPR